MGGGGATRTAPHVCGWWWRCLELTISHAGLWGLPLDQGSRAWATAKPKTPKAIGIWPDDAVAAGAAAVLVVSVCARNWMPLRCRCMRRVEWGRGCCRDSPYALPMNPRAVLFANEPSCSAVCIPYTTSALRIAVPLLHAGRSAPPSAPPDRVGWALGGAGKQQCDADAVPAASPPRGIGGARMGVPIAPPCPALPSRRPVLLCVSVCKLMAIICPRERERESESVACGERRRACWCVRWLVVLLVERG